MSLGNTSQSLAKILIITPFLLQILKPLTPSCHHPFFLHFPSLPKQAEEQDVNSRHPHFLCSEHIIPLIHLPFLMICICQ